MRKRILILGVSAAVICSGIGLLLDQFHYIKSKYSQSDVNIVYPSRRIVDGMTRTAPGPKRSSALIWNRIKEADIVAVGSLESVSVKNEASSEYKGNMLRGREYKGIVKIQAVYKGDLESSKEIVVYSFLPKSLPRLDFEDEGFRQGQTNLYFLKSESGKKISVVAPYFSTFPVLPERPKISKSQKVENAVESELLQNIRNGDESLILSSLELLGKSEDGIKVCREVLARNSSLVIKGAAVAYRLRNQDNDAFEEALKIIEEAHERKDITAFNIIQNIAEAIPYSAGVLSKSQIRILVNMNDPAIQSKLGQIIHNNGKSELAPIAMEILKSSENRQVKYDAIQMLAHLRGEGPSWRDFMNDPQKYTDEYTAWWDKEGKKEFGDK